MIKKLDATNLPDWTFVDVYDKSGNLLFEQRNCDIRKYQEEIQTRTGPPVKGLWVISGKVESKGHWDFFDHSEVTLRFIGSDERLDVVIQADGEFKLGGNGYYSEE